MPLTLTKRLDLVLPMTPAQADANWQAIMDQFNALQTAVGVALNADGTLKAGAISTAAQFNAAFLATITVPVGSVLASTSETLGTTAGADGWIEAAGQSVVTSGVFAALYAIYNAAGLPWGSAGAGFFYLPDFRNCTLVGASPGSVSAQRPSVRNLGDEGTTEIGAETHVLTEAELPAHVHDILGKNLDVGAAISPSFIIIDDERTASSVTKQSNSAGSGAAHSNVQPSGVVRWLIRL